MTVKEAMAIVGDRARWELKRMKRALEKFPMLNDEEDNKRLAAIKVLLKASRGYIIK